MHQPAERDLQTLALELSTLAGAGLGAAGLPWPPPGAQPESVARRQAALQACVQLQAVERAAPVQRGRWLLQGLQTPHPARYLRVLRSAGALRRLLPEVDALFGVPQLVDAPDWIDVGEHLLRRLDEAAAQQAPLAVRLATLLQPIGKGATPREIWPAHFKHEVAGARLFELLSTRLALPQVAGEAACALARLAIAELDRLHRANDVRAGAMAALLARVDAPGQPQRFEQLLQVGACDYRATPGHAGEAYPQGGRWRRALAAWQATAVDGLDEDAALMARAQAIARAAQPPGLPPRAGDGAAALPPPSSTPQGPAALPLPEPGA